MLGADADGRAALRAVRAECGVPRRRCRQPDRPGGDQVLDGDEPVVRAEEVRQVTHHPACVFRGGNATVRGDLRGGAAVDVGPQFRRLGDQFVPDVVRGLLRLGRAFRHCLFTPL